MFTRKSKAEKAADQAKGKAQKAAAKAKDRADKAQGEASKRLSKADTWLHEQGQSAQARVSEARAKGLAATEHATHDARERLGTFAAGAAAQAAVARDKAVAGIDHGIDVAAPKVSDAVGAVGPKVDHARDVIVDDYLPKLQQLLGSLVDRKDEVLAKPDGAVAVVTGAPKKKGPKGLVLLAIGTVAAAGAGIAAYLAQQQKAERKADPWAEPTGATTDLSSDTGRYRTPGETTTGVTPVGGEFPVRTSAEPPAAGADTDSDAEVTPAELADGTAEANDDIAPGTPSADEGDKKD